VGVETNYYSASRSCIFPKNGMAKIFDPFQVLKVSETQKHRTWVSSSATLEKINGTRWKILEFNKKQDSELKYDENTKDYHIINNKVCG
jgi:hypothetical protein